MGKSKINTLLIVIYIYVLFIASAMTMCCSMSLVSTLKCKPSERQALLKFKHSVTFLDELVSSSWEGEDCCSWPRVRCDPTTGNVIGLHLHGICHADDYPFVRCNNFFETKQLELSLLYLAELSHLEHLDVSINGFRHSKIPRFMGSMKQLRYLNLSYNNFFGIVPHELGNLTNLQVLDVSNFDPSGLSVDSLNWASNLRELRHLDLSYTNLSQAHDWIDSLMLSNPLPRLRELILCGCSLPMPRYVTYQTGHYMNHNSSLLPTPIPIRYLDLGGNILHGGIPHFIQNLTSLEYLSLSKSRFGFRIPLWLGKLRSLTHLDLSFSIATSIEGGNNVWDIVKNLCSLKSLDLSNNELQGNLLERHHAHTNCTRFDLELLDLSRNFHITGQIPSWLGDVFWNLKTLSLGSNNLSGVIPTSLGKLSALQYLDISYNSLESAVLSESYFVNLSSLMHLELCQTFLTFNFPSNWVPPFQLQVLNARSCKINGHFPKWIRTQKKLKFLDFSDARIRGVLPNWLQNMQSLYGVELANNQITGCPKIPINFQYFSVSNNSLSCRLFTTNDSSSSNNVYVQAQSLHLSDNFISGELLQHLYQKMPTLSSLFLSNNQISGSIPESMCHFTNLNFLELKNNSLSGEIPKCFGNSLNLVFVSLSFNKLSGNIPCFSSKYGKNSPLSFLHLSDNRFSGHVPSCLANLSNLATLDVGENQLSGEIPTWITAKGFPNLQILRLRNNKLSGIIPNQLCFLPNLQILDLGHNDLCGTIPRCLGNLTKMGRHPTNNGYVYVDTIGVMEVTQGIEREYTSTLEYLVSIDLSCNKLVGSIPKEMTDLQGLFSLNMSYNQLTGCIPTNIGDMKSLLSLDFSRNKLHGTIPTTMADLYYLEHLNLSYNNFSGQIPTGFQLQTLNDPSIYAANPYLCGDPLTKKCETNHHKDHDNQFQYEEDDEESKHEKMWFYLVVMSGIATGFWGVVGTLLLKKGWRHVLFRQVEHVYDWVYVVVAAGVAKLKEKCDRSSEQSNIPT